MTDADTNEEEKDMPKGYWIGNSTVADMDGLWRYREANREVMNRYGGVFIVVHGRHEIPEGPLRPTQTVVEFPSYQAAVDCYHDPEYQKAARLREQVSEGTMVIVEGFEQPPGF